MSHRVTDSGEFRVEEYIFGDNDFMFMEEIIDGQIDGPGAEEHDASLDTAELSSFSQSSVEECESVDFNDTEALAAYYVENAAYAEAFLIGVVPCSIENEPRPRAMSRRSVGREIAEFTS